MKKEISTGAMVGIIALVVVVVGFLGYKLFLGGGKGKPYAADYYQKQGGAAGSAGTGSGGMVPPVGGMRSGGMGSSGGMVPPSGGMRPPGT